MTPNELLALIDQAAAEGWTKLDLSGQGLTELPPEIGKLTQLEILILGKAEKWEWVDRKYTPTLITNQLTTLPACLKNLQNLRLLDLSGNPLAVIPDVVFTLQQLESLTAIGCGLIRIPDSFAQLTNLTGLDLGNNQLSEIPDSFAQLTNLTGLSLHSNQLSEIPDAIAQLTKLTELVLWGNQLREIPSSIAQLTKLRVFQLNSNQLREIPDSITQLTNLTELYLYNNQLTEIPDAIAQLTDLTGLDLGGNQLTEIPGSVTQLTNLTELYLSNNQLSEIPDAIAQLTNLKELYLENNKITHLPEWLESLPNLKTLTLSGNPLPIHSELLKKEDPEAIFNYCRQLRSGLVRPLNEIKLLLVGQGSVGKTSLIKRLIDNRYDPNEAQTDGLSVTSWQIEVNSKPVRVNVWDFGGQEIYHATHQFFLTKRSLYILVVNCRTGDENRIDYWLKLIESFGDQSPVIIVGNKCDEQPLDLNRRALRQKYPNIRAILETSCQTNYGIEELRTAIYQEISDLKEVYDLLPLAWFEVKQQLEQLDEDCISYAKYVGICAKQEISEEVQQERLIELLHDLGLVLNFRKHPILQNTSVLKPNWVTEGIYSLLSDDDLKTINQGILTADDLSRVLDATRYPANRHHFLIELIKQFQLGFPLDETHLLIPGLLPKEEPEDTQLEGETLEFQYHYSVLPDSVISRFIVLIHPKIHNHIYWRTGVMLAYRESNGTILNLARVRSDPADCKISIAINGRETTRRSFLSLIRDVFYQIHRSFANLNVTEWVPVPGYPDHSPLDYQELLGLETMGIQDYPIGKLGIKVNVRQLLDGYEAVESRQFRRMRDRGIELDHREFMDREFMPGIYLNINQNNQDRRSTTHQHGQGDNVAGDAVQGDKVMGNSNETAER